MDSEIGVPQKGCTKTLIRVKEIKPREAGNSTDRLSGYTGGRCERLPKRLGGLSVLPLMNYQRQLGYMGLFLRTLRLDLVH
jgi:hypothetical protein